MGRGKRYSLPAIALFTAVNVGVTWSRFNSTIYPYSIAQPSSFRHIAMPNASGAQVDYFFPSLGSSITNLNVWAQRDHSPPDDGAFLRGQGGKNVHRTEWMYLAGRREPLIRADFKGLPGRWTIERVSFVARGLVWYITASYDVRYRNLRPTLLRMMRSFRLR
jgi:hypothetical protein